MPKSNTRKLNDTQLVILSSASQREDGFAVLPEGVRAASVKAAVIRLTKLGFLKQVRIKRDQPHWSSDEGGRRIGLKITTAGSAAVRKARAHHAPTARNLRFPRRKDWLCLPKRALLSWPGRSSRGERLMGKEALLTPLPRGEWRGRGGGGGCRHEPQRRASCRSRTPVSSMTPSSLFSRRPHSARTALRSCLRA